MTSKTVTNKIELSKKVAMATLKQHIESAHLSAEQLRFIASVLGIDVPSANYFPSEDKYQNELVSVLLKHFETLDQNLWGATKSFAYWGGATIFFTGLQSYSVYKLFGDITTTTPINCNDDDELKEQCKVFGLKGDISLETLKKDNDLIRSFHRHVLKHEEEFKHPDHFCKGNSDCVKRQSDKISNEIERRKGIIRKKIELKSPISNLSNKLLWVSIVGFIIFVVSIGGTFSFYRLLFRAYQSAKNKWRASRIMNMIRKVMTATPSQYPKTLDPRQMCFLQTACSGKCRNVNGTCVPTDEAMFKYSLANYRTAKKNKTNGK